MELQPTEKWQKRMLKRAIKTFINVRVHNGVAMIEEEEDQGLCHLNLPLDINGVARIYNMTLFAAFVKDIARTNCC